MKLTIRLAPVLVLILALGAALACNAPLAGLIPPTRIPVSTEAAGQLIENLTSITPGPGGEVTVTMTQEELTSYVALELAKTPDVPIKDPQIALANGRIDFTGTLGLAGVEAKTEILMKVTADSEGKPVLEIVSAEFGPLPVPKEILDGVSTAATDALVNGITTEAGTKVKLTSVEIGDGVMTVVGVRE